MRYNAMLNVQVNNDHFPHSKQHSSIREMKSFHMSEFLMMLNRYLIGIEAVMWKL